MNNKCGNSIAAYIISTYINFVWACFFHFGNSYLSDTSYMIMHHKYVINHSFICDCSDSLLSPSLENIVKAAEQGGIGDKQRYVTQFSLF
jgi:hypothetical protein